MSNKSRLQTNNTNLQSLINKANALPDAGGGGSATIEILPITVTNNGMYEPGTNEYVLSNDNLHSSSRSIIIITQSATHGLLVFFRENLSNSFIVARGSTAESNGLNVTGVIVNENSITATGMLTETGYNFVVI